MDKLFHKIWVDNEISISPELHGEIKTGIENFKVALTQLNLYLSALEMNNFRRLCMNFETATDYIEKYKNSSDSGEDRENERVLIEYTRYILLDNAKVIESIGKDTRKMFDS